MDLGLFIARKTFFWYPKPGQPQQVHLGAVARKGHPVIEAEPSAWEPLKVTFEVKQEAPERKSERSVRRT